MDWTRILAYVTGTVDQELLLARNEYLAAENRILKSQWAIEALGRRAIDAREDRSSPGPPSELAPTGFSNRAGHDQGTRSRKSQ
jgi:hypothetical protein